MKTPRSIAALDAALRPNDSDQRPGHTMTPEFQMTCDGAVRCTAWLGRVLVACEYSGTVRDAFAARGWDAWSCDLLPSEKPGNHYQCDVREVLREKWDILIGHPTCTYMSNSGVSWLHKSAERWMKLFEAADFFGELWNADVPHIALENPVMHKYAKRLIGVKQSQVVQPWMFSHLEGKATCLWLKNLPPLTETNNVKSEMMKLPDNQRQRLHYLPPSPERWKERSRTFSGLAEAMANQWTLATRPNAALCDGEKKGNEYE